MNILCLPSSSWASGPLIKKIFGLECQNQKITNFMALTCFKVLHSVIYFINFGLAKFTSWSCSFRSTLIKSLNSSIFALQNWRHVFAKLTLASGHRPRVLAIYVGLSLPLCWICHFSVQKHLLYCHSKYIFMYLYCSHGFKCSWLWHATSQLAPDA